MDMVNKVQSKKKEEAEQEASWEYAKFTSNAYIKSAKKVKVGILRSHFEYASMVSELAQYFAQCDDASNFKLCTFKSDTLN